MARLLGQALVFAIASSSLAAHAQPAIEHQLDPACSDARRLRARAAVRARVVIERDAGMFYGTLTVGTRTVDLVDPRCRALMHRLEAELARLLDQALADSIRAQRVESERISQWSRMLRPYFAQSEPCERAPPEPPGYEPHLRIVERTSRRSEYSAHAPPDEASEALPTLGIEGRAVLHDVVLSVRCDGAYRCAIALSYLVRAEGDVVLELVGAPPEHVRVHLRVHGKAVRGPIHLPAGEIAPVELRWNATLAVPGGEPEGVFCGGRRDEENECWLGASPIRARHPILAQTPSPPPLERTDVHGRIFSGDGVLPPDFVRIRTQNLGAVRVVVQRQYIAGASRAPLGDGTFHVFYGGDLRRERRVQHGGPFAAFGAMVFLHGEARPMLRIGYEIGLATFVVASIEVQTDFHSLYEALVIEVGTPSVIFIFPGLSFGLGGVLRQFGDRPMDGTLRVRFAWQWPVFGVTVDVDYWPELGDASVSASARLSW